MVYIITDRKKEPEKKANNKNCYFPKKSHHGYFDSHFQKHFYDKKQKLDYMNKHGFVEHDGASKTHIERVKDFTEYCKDEKRKHGKDWKYKGAYPD